MLITQLQFVCDLCEISLSLNKHFFSQYFFLLLAEYELEKQHFSNLTFSNLQ